MKKQATVILAAAALLSCCGKINTDNITMNGKLIQSTDCGVKTSSVTDTMVKPAENANPLIANIFCADPTAVEYNGRLYVYGTNDHQQYEAVGTDGKNTYEYIKSLVMLSTDDMVNWMYHGTIDVGDISPWIIASWAPSIVSREEADGKTHFYLYYSNSGWGMGVLTSTSPTGPWSDPLGRSIIDGNTKGLNGCKSPFDPGALIDGNGTGWLSFGGGTDSARIVRLGKDMISLDSEIMSIPSPHHFEASELNYINDTYVYTYNNNWDTRIKWDSKRYGTNRSPACSMAYFTTKTPLDSDSWEYRGHYFKNPGEQGLEYSNNHTHLQKYQGKYYLFYHAMFPQKSLGTDGGFRSLCVNEAAVDEKTVTISEVAGNKTGVSQIKAVDPFSINQAETMASSADIKYNHAENGNMTVSSVAAGTSAAWTLIKGADFSDKPSVFAARVKGKGNIKVYADRIDGNPISEIEFDTDDFAVIYNGISEKVKGQHNLYFLISSGAEFDEWQFS